MRALQALTKLIGPGRLDALLDVLHENDPEILIAVMNVLEAHPGLAPKGALKEVQLLSDSPNVKVRCRAIEVLGTLGEIDTVERLCMFPTKDRQIQTAIWNSIQRILAKPVNILYLKWENFEYLIQQLLRALEYEDVQMTQQTYDEGVDVLAYRRGTGSDAGSRQFVVVQCKRWRAGSIGAVEVQKLIASCAAKGGKRRGVCYDNGLPGRRMGTGSQA